jgi:pyrroloquinoline quinone biosynthesis protein B
VAVCRNGIAAPQTQSSLAVSANGRDWAILNASPDIRQQLSWHGTLHPRSLRDSPVASVLVTNGDIDHIAGLLVLREKQPFNLFATSAIHAILGASPVFGVLDEAFVPRLLVALDEPFALLPGLTCRLFAVPGKVPLFMEETTADIAREGEETVGAEMHCAGRRIYYIPGCGAVTETLAQRIRGADLVFFDGTLFTDDEMIATGTGVKTGRRMGHMPITGEGGSLEALGSLTIGRRVYVHINNTNPIWRDGPERRTVETAGFDIGHDGMEIEL